MNGKRAEPSVTDQAIPKPVDERDMAPNPKDETETDHIEEEGEPFGDNFA